MIRCLLLLAALTGATAAWACPAEFDDHRALGSPEPCFIHDTTYDEAFFDVSLGVITLPVEALGRRLSELRDVDDLSDFSLPAAASGGYAPDAKSPKPGLAFTIKSATAQFVLANQGTGLGEVRGELQAHTRSNSQSMAVATVVDLAINGRTTTGVKEVDWIYQWNLTPSVTFKAVRAFTGLDDNNESDSYRADLQLRW